jgi:hypothetical protein
MNEHHFGRGLLFIFTKEAIMQIDAIKETQTQTAAALLHYTTLSTGTAAAQVPGAPAVAADGMRRSLCTLCAARRP